MTHKQNLQTHTHTHTQTQKHKNKVEKYILGIVWIVGLIKTSTMDFKNIKWPK